MGTDTHPEIRGLIRGKSKKIKDQARRTVEILEDSQAEEIAVTLRCSVHEVYIEAMRLGISPYRYLRNRDAISIDEQLELAESQVSVIGA
ncbi:MAG: hypothetical protein JRJ70_17255, partial [Deltaproteobacteria bacterium]|nr:hypothetical protein [Deltaproteobacteria bacterium]